MPATDCRITPGAATVERVRLLRMLAERDLQARAGDGEAPRVRPGLIAEPRPGDVHVERRRPRRSQGEPLAMTDDCAGVEVHDLRDRHEDEPEAREEREEHRVARARRVADNRTEVPPLDLRAWMAVVVPRQLHGRDLGRGGRAPRGIRRRRGSGPAVSSHLNATRRGRRRFSSRPAAVILPAGASEQALAAPSANATPSPCGCCSRPVPTRAATGTTTASRCRSSGRRAAGGTRRSWSCSFATGPKRTSTTVRSHSSARRAWATRPRSSGCSISASRSTRAPTTAAPPHAASYAGSAPTVRLLPERGADLEAPDTSLRQHPARVGDGRETESVTLSPDDPKPRRLRRWARGQATLGARWRVLPYAMRGCCAPVTASRPRGALLGRYGVDVALGLRAVRTYAPLRPLAAGRHKALAHAPEALTRRHGRARRHDSAHRPRASWAYGRPAYTCAIAALSIPELAKRAACTQGEASLFVHQWFALGIAESITAATGGTVWQLSPLGERLLRHCLPRGARAPRLRQAARGTGAQALRNGAYAGTVLGDRSGAWRWWRWRWCRATGRGGEHGR